MTVSMHAAASDPVPADATPVSWPSVTVTLTSRRMASVLVGAWLAVEGYGVLTAPANTFHAPLLAAAAIGVGLITSVIVGLRPSVPAAWLVGGSSIALVADLLLTDLRRASDHGFVVFWLPGVVAVSAGFLLRERVSRLIILAVAGGSATLILSRVVPVAGWRPGLTTALESICFTLTDGVAAILLTRAMRDVAAAADREMTRADAERAAQERAASRRAIALELAARLHDTVINTLSALVVRGDVLDQQAIRAACVHSADTVDSILAGGDVADLTDPVGRILDGARQGEAAPGAGVELIGVSPEEFGVLLGGVPDPVRAALVGAVREALVNVARHSGRNLARVEVRATDEVFEIVVADDGAGFDGRVIPGRGLHVSVLQRCAAVGVDVRIDSAPGRGTRVVFGYEPSDADPAGAASDRQAIFDSEELLRSVRRPFAARIGYSVAGMCACLTLITTTGWSSWSSWLALGVLAVVLVTAPGRLDDQGWLTAAGVGLVIAVIPALIGLPGLGATGCNRVSTSWWGTDGALVPFVLLVFLSRGWWPTAAGLLVYSGAVGVVAQSVWSAGCGTAAVLAGVLDAVAVIAMIYFRMYLSRVARRASVANARARAARLGEVEREATLRVRRADLATVLHEASGLLRRIASGDLDPRDPVTREQCALMERHVRQLTRLQHRHDELGAILTVALGLAHAAGVALVLRLGEDDVPTAEAATTMAAVLHAVLDACRRGDTVTVVHLGSGVGSRLTITAPCSSPPGLAGIASPGTLEAAREAGWDVRCSDLVEQYLIEFRWRGQAWTTPARDPADRSRPVGESGSASSTTTPSSATA
ncbi:MAG: ATP-binding protein [Kineosporiaceae bacterium]|nr:ATP-binding protein [Kineosporiaceae bacterium]